MKRFAYVLLLSVAVLGVVSCKGPIANRTGVTHYREGNINKALQEFDAALDLKSDYRFARNNRGLVNYLAGNYSAALHDYNMALAVRPDYPEARNNRAVLFLDRGDDERALLDLDRAIEKREKYQEAHFNRARLFLATQELDRALESIDQAIELRAKGSGKENEWPEALYLRAMILQQLGDFDAADADFHKALEQAPQLGLQYEDPYPGPLKPGRLSG